MYTKPWGYLSAYCIPLCLVIGYVAGGGYHFLTPVVVFGIIPLLDLWVGVRAHNPEPHQYQTMRDNPIFSWLLWFYVPCQYGLVIWGARIFAAGNLTAWERIGLVLSTGIVTGGVGITLAHELGHRSRRWEQNLGKALLLSVSYMHFFIEHNQGHHARVATREDPASARLGESFYAFYPRSLFGGYRHAWFLEKKRLRRRGKPFWSSANQMIWFFLLPLALAGALTFLWGGMALVFFLAQSVLAFSLLEMINFIEHYGLERRQLPSGATEKVDATHSWNAGEVVTNLILFQLQRHSDHHVQAHRRYQTLRHFPESPQLPTGYAGMVLLALVPPLWRRVMDPKLASTRSVPKLGAVR